MELRLARAGEPAGEDKAWLEETMGANGAVIAGRGTYQAAGHWGGKNPWGAPFFVVTHRPEEQPPGGDFIFAGSLAEAIDRAKAVAGALERMALLLADWRDTRAWLACTEQRMTAVLDELGLTGLVTSITGLSAVGAAAILAETGDPRRFTTGRALARHDTVHGTCACRGALGKTCSSGAPLA